MTASLHLQTTPTGTLTVVSLAGELDLAVNERLRATLAEAAATPAATIVLDLQLTTFLDSTTLGVLVGASKKIRAEGRRLIAVNVTGLPLKVMTLTGLVDVFEVYGPTRSPDEEITALLAQLAALVP